jgi:cytochrome P450
MTGSDGFLGRPLLDSELAEESMGGMFGGSGTTANTFAYLLWASLRQPWVVKRLRAELQEAFNANDRAVPLAAVRRPLGLRESHLWPSRY